MKKNFLLITLDNVRYDFLAHPNNNWIKTPNFRSFAKESYQFSNHYVQIPFTPPSHYSLLDGADLMGEHNKIVRLIQYLFGNTMPKFFKKKKYLTAAIVSALVLRRDMNLFVQGKFDVYDDFFETQIQENHQKEFLLNSIRSRNRLINLLNYTLKRNNMKKMYPELPVQRGDVTTQKVISFIEKNKNCNWFLWVHYFDAHVASPLRQYMIDKYNKSFDDTHGYFAPPNYLHMYDIEDKMKNSYIYENITTDRAFVDKTNKYAGCVSYLDELFGNLIEFLKMEGLYDNTIIILTSDHGTPLGKYGHASKVTNVYECTVKVPLLIKVNGKGKTIDGITKHSDLLALTKRIYNESDISIDKLDKNNTVYFESPRRFNHSGDIKMYGMRIKSFKFIIELVYGNNGIECRHYYFDLIKDPYENNNMFDSIDDVKKKELINQLKTKFAGLNDYRDIIGEFRSSTDDEEIKRRLEELGYL